MIAARRLEQVNEYYFSGKLKEIAQMASQGKRVINMGIGSPDMAPSPSVLEAITASLHEAGAHKYQSYQGLAELREAMAGFYQEHFGVTLNPSSEILPLMGSKEGIMHISMAFLNEGDAVLIPNPGYPAYASAAQIAGGIAVPYELSAQNNWEPDFDALEQTDLTKVKIMWVNYPHMPTGAKGSLDLLQRLVAFARKHNILLVNDNPYSFVLNDEQLSVFQVDGAREVALELNSLSKTFNMAGWRVGMLTGRQELLETVMKVKSNMDSGMFYGLQKGAIVALKSDYNWFASLNKVYDSRRKLIYKLADALGCKYDKNAVGLFVWAKLPEGEPSAEAYVDEILYESHVFITPGTVFGSAGEGYIRFSLCVPEPQIEEALLRIEKVEQLNSKFA